jgi:enterochelin esterase-like enzyme
VLIVPLATMGRRGWVAMRKRPFLAEVPSMWASFFSFMVGMVLVGSLILSTLGTGPLLTYGLTTNLYRPATLSVSRHGTLQQGTFPSPSLGGITRTYWIYLPSSYMTTISKRYPTFYLLHGSPGGPQDWFQAAHAATTVDTLLAQGNIRETILIGVDGNGPQYGFSEWANSFDGRQRMEDALVKDLVSFIDSHYRSLTRATERTIGGLSMGGYGAVNIALHHPDIFHKVMCLSGYFQAEGPVFGVGLQSNAYRQLNSPSLFLQTPKGRQNATRLTVVLGIGTVDGRYYHKGLAFYKQLSMMKISVRLLTDVGGHAWTLWAKQFGKSLPFLEPASLLSHA